MSLAASPQAAAPSRRFDLAIFDCDGVLVDSERIANREFASLLKEIGLDFTLPQMFETFVGNTMTRCVEIITERLGHAPPDDLLDRYHAMIRVALEREVSAVPGVIALLDALDQAGIPYAVASNGEHAKMATTLGVTGLLPRFDGRRFSAADVARPKPWPDLFLHAAQTLGVNPHRCVVIEDSPLGVQGACAAGMEVIGFADLMSPDRLLAAGAGTTVSHMTNVLPLLYE
ncbi:MAG: HAD family phosphatase [Gemmatimonadaceae bacterium]|nr:HAD family phosphatase [Gemmatimonadaceae bacterium]